jgi:hypothetical protein
LQIRDARFIERLHLFEMPFLAGKDTVLENHVNGGKRDPAEEEQPASGKDRLHLRTEGEKLNPAVAADIDLALGKNNGEAPPGALPE